MKAPSALQRGMACLCCRKRKMVRLLALHACPASRVPRHARLTAICLFRNVMAPAPSAPSAARPAAAPSASTTRKNAPAALNSSRLKSPSSRPGYASSRLNSLPTPHPPPPSPHRATTRLSLSTVRTFSYLPHIPSFPSRVTRQAPPLCIPVLNASSEPGDYAFGFDGSVFNTPELDYDLFLPPTEPFPTLDPDFLAGINDPSDIWPADGGFASISDFLQPGPSASSPSTSSLLCEPTAGPSTNWWENDVFGEHKQIL